MSKGSGSPEGKPRYSARHLLLTIPRGNSRFLSRPAGIGMTAALVLLSVSGYTNCENELANCQIGAQSRGGCQCASLPGEQWEASRPGKPGSEGEQFGDRAAEAGDDRAAVQLLAG